MNRANYIKVGDNVLVNCDTVADIALGEATGTLTIRYVGGTERKFDLPVETAKKAFNGLWTILRDRSGGMDLGI